MRPRSPPHRKQVGDVRQARSATPERTDTRPRTKSRGRSRDRKATPDPHLSQPEREASQSRDRSAKRRPDEPAKPVSNAKNTAQKLMHLIDIGKRTGRLEEAEQEYQRVITGGARIHGDIDVKGLMAPFQAIRSLAERVAASQEGDAKAEGLQKATFFLGQTEEELLDEWRTKNQQLKNLKEDIPQDGSFQSVRAGIRAMGSDLWFEQMSTEMSSKVAQAELESEALAELAAEQPQSDTIRKRSVEASEVFSKAREQQHELEEKRKALVKVRGSMGAYAEPKFPSSPSASRSLLVSASSATERKRSITTTMDSTYFLKRKSIDERVKEENMHHARMRLREESLRETAREIANLRSQLERMEEYVEELKSQPELHEGEESLRVSLQKKHLHKRFGYPSSDVGVDVLELYFPRLELQDFQREMMEDLIAEFKKCGATDRIMGSLFVRVSGMPMQHMVIRSERVSVEVSGNPVYIRELREKVEGNVITIRGADAQLQAPLQVWKRNRKGGVTLMLGIYECEALECPNGQPIEGTPPPTPSEKAAFCVASVVGQSDVSVQTPSVTVKPGMSWNFTGELRNVLAGDALIFSVYMEDPDKPGDVLRATIVGSFTMGVVRLVLPGSSFEDVVPLKAELGSPTLSVSVRCLDTEFFAGFSVVMLSTSNLPMRDTREDAKPPDPYCVCSVLSNDPKHVSQEFLKTRTRASQINLEWGQGGRITAMRGDRLEFKVYDAYLGRRPERSADPDECVGTATLPTDMINERPFIGELELSVVHPFEPGEAKPFLKVKVEAVSACEEEPDVRRRFSRGQGDTRWWLFDIPGVLWVKVAPRNDDYQKPISGVYSLELQNFKDYSSELKRYNGMPCWKQEAGVHYIFSGPSGHWYFGDTFERDQGFDASVAVMRSQCPHQGMMPDDMYRCRNGGWKMVYRKQWFQAASTVVTRVEPDKMLVPNFWRACPDIRDKVKYSAHGFDVREYTLRRFHDAVGDNRDGVEEWEFVYCMRQQFLLPRTSISDARLKELFSILCRGCEVETAKACNTLDLKRFLQFVEWSWAEDLPIPTTGYFMNADMRHAQEIIRLAINYDAEAPRGVDNEPMWSMPKVRYKWMQKEVQKLEDLFGSAGKDVKFNFQDFVAVFRTTLKVDANTWPDSMISKVHQGMLRRGEDSVSFGGILDLVDPELRVVQREMQRFLKLQIDDECVFPDPGMEVKLMKHSGRDKYFVDERNAATFLQMVFHVGDVGAANSARSSQSLAPTGQVADTTPDPDDVARILPGNGSGGTVTKPQRRAFSPPRGNADRRKPPLANIEVLAPKSLAADDTEWHKFAKESLEGYTSRPLVADIPEPLGFPRSADSARKSADSARKSADSARKSTATGLKSTGSLKKRQSDWSRSEASSS